MNTYRPARSGSNGESNGPFHYVLESLPSETDQDTTSKSTRTARIEPGSMKGIVLEIVGDFDEPLSEFDGIV